MMDFWRKPQKEAGSAPRADEVLSQ
jgi:hypothetical protein